MADIQRRVEMGGELIGAGLFVSMVLVQLVTGTSLGDYIFSQVLSMVSLAKTVRQNHIFLFWILLIGQLVLIGLALVYRKKSAGVLALGLTRIATGWLVLEWLLFTQINQVFFRNAVLAIPFLLGMGLLSLTILGIWWDQKLHLPGEMQTDGKWHLDRQQLNQFLRPLRYLIVGILALSLILPAMAPLAGFQATPPPLPTPYGGQPGPYQVSKIRLDHHIPANISKYLLPDNNNQSWYTFLYLPRVKSSQQVPLVIYAHGYTGTNPADYENSLYQLASRGSAVIFVQYVTEVQLSGALAEPADTNFTRSNAMYIRYLMEWDGILQAVSFLQGTSSSDQTTQIQAVLDPSALDTGYIQVIGHSVGGGMVPYLASKIVEHGWATQQLLLDLETPWFAAQQPDTGYNLSLLPASTIVNIAGSQDDHLASPCIGMGLFEQFHRVLPSDNLAYLLVPSDYHGYPRLIATHYLVTSTLDDTLTRWGYMKRVDAMAGYLVALANNNSDLSMLSYFQGGGPLMLSQGNWSDGTSVHPLRYSQDPFGLRGGADMAQQFLHSHDVGPRICAR